MLNKLLGRYVVIFVAVVCCGLLYWEYIGVESKVRCYAETPIGTVRLDGICTVRTSGIGWQYRKDYTVVLAPVKKGAGDEGFFFYYLRNSQGRTSVNWNADLYNSHAQAMIDAEFVVKDRGGRGRCWESDEAVVCFYQY
jgi:hypothetical protein|tara:strand:+ start:244 stop:660 length:417 start_codon:yes stop_codon:yes gene_type:complete